MVSTSVNIGGGITLKNPILTASGTFGYGLEFDPFQDLNELGGFIVKGTTLHPRQGNPYPRMAETTAGMLNCVGLQNRGVDYLVEHILPQLSHYDTEVLVNVSGSTIDDYVACAERLNDHPKVRAIELNISCPNVKEGGMSFGVNCESAYEVVSAVRKAYKGLLMVKLSPNVTDITAIARAAEEAGADSLSLINTLLGMAIDVKTRKPKLSTITGGLSGPAVKPIAVRMVWQVSQAVSIPVIGLGGIASVEDVVEFLLAGATAVQVGTYNFVEPDIASKLVHGLTNYLEENHISDVNELIGALSC
ncbi:dihydroorotate dehydrogenase [Porphyromonas uenonis]|uniref:dihydroorotate dehydrogenase n=1 Tax=Porphyromonas uenonis TaxID=281920 RepID=UPI002889D087|nr:dihydroorotate dehydrogenase [Porphyromonas uenonis]